MTMYNKKTGAVSQQPRKRARTTASQRDLHRRIEEQSRLSQNPPRCWYPEEYPELYALVEAARAEACSRRRLRGRIVFNHKGRSYAARFTNLDRIIVEDRQTGRFIASSGFFAM